MFKENLSSTIESAGSIIFDQFKFSSFGKIIVSRNNIRNESDGEGPFQGVER
jgi:hypothetical protein